MTNTQPSIAGATGTPDEVPEPPTMLQQILARQFACECGECQVESSLAAQFDVDLSKGSPGAVQEERMKLRQEQAKRRRIISDLSAFQIASLGTVDDRIAALWERLQQLRDGRKARFIDCDAFWALVEEHRPLHVGFVPFPTRDEQDVMLAKFARPKKRKAA